MNKQLKSKEALNPKRNLKTLLLLVSAVSASVGIFVGSIGASASEEIVPLTSEQIEWPGGRKHTLAQNCEFHLSSKELVCELNVSGVKDFKGNQRKATATYSVSHVTIKKSGVSKVVVSEASVKYSDGTSALQTECSDKSTCEIKSEPSGHSEKALVPDEAPIADKE